MRHPRPLGFDDLETRKLLSKVHHPAVHSDPIPAFPPAQVAAPVTLDGTLVAHNKGVQISTDGYGDQTTETPVSGVLGGVGMVRGTWYEAADSSGSYLGPDTIQLQNAKGSFLIVFDVTTAGQSEQTPQGTTVYQGASQQLHDGTGAFAKASESGFIQMNTNAKETVVESLTLTSK